MPDEDPGYIPLSRLGKSGEIPMRFVRRAAWWGIHTLGEASVHPRCWYEGTYGFGPVGLSSLMEAFVRYGVTPYGFEGEGIAISRKK